MYMLKVDGVTVPTPSGYSSDMMEISHAERNAVGTMVKDFIAMKNKLNVSWKMLTQEQLKILGVIKRKPSFILEYYSMETGKMEFGNYYVGDLKANAMRFKDGEVDKWLDITMNFIEL